MRFWIRASLVSCLGISFLIAVGMRFLNEDLMVALCSGRTTVAGFLAKPDQWSFTMPGKIWVDQSWLSHLICYLSYSVLDDWGPVLLKTLLLTLCSIVLYLRCRSLGAEMETTVGALTLGTLALAPFLQIRAENFGLLYFLVLAGILTWPAPRRRWRQAGCLAILALWCNSHGSFLLGLVLLGLRVVVEILCRFDLRATLHIGARFGHSGTAALYGGSPPVNILQDQESEKSDVFGWLATWLASIAIIAFLNPYGPSNALLPFRQLSASRMTGQSADWIPMLDLNQLWQHGFLQPLDVKPFLIFLGLIGILIVTALPNRGIREKLRLLAAKLRPETLMEALVPLVLIVMAFRFRRMILFAAASLVPVTAVLLQAHIEEVRGRFSGLPHSGYPSVRLIVGGMLTVCALFLVGQFVRKTVLPYSPANPLRSDRPVISQLMSFDSYTMDVAQFMRDNGVKGRMLTSWTAGAFLMFCDPEIKVFMDARDQSFYSDEIIDLYFSIMNSNRQNIARTLQILDQYQVSYALLATNVSDFNLATFLMETKKWACIYKDNEFILLGRVEPNKFEAGRDSSDLKSLHYRSDDTRLVSDAVRSQFLTGDMPAELLKWLQDYCRRKPSPDLYSLTTLALNGNSPCLNPAAKSFLMSEASRLANMDYMVADGCTNIVKSLVIVAGILEGDELRCHAGAHAQTYAKLKKRAARISGDLDYRYRGY